MSSLPARLQQLIAAPNPVWMREMRQAARLTRTPIILALVTVMVTLLITSIGGIASISTAPARVGLILFHTFFSVAYAVVAWLGPAVAASSIASERSGRTWEAVLLTGLSVSAITRGKFLAALTYLWLYLVMLAPVGTVCFLFGGVSASEVLLAFLLLASFGVMSVAFGLSLSSKFATPGAALVVTLLVALPLSILVYILLGPSLSVAVHQVWPAVPRGAPVWLPVAYGRAEFGSDYVLYLLVAPFLSLVMPTWLLYELTKANLLAPSDDRSSGVRLWYICATLLLGLVLAGTGLIADSMDALVVCAVLLAIYLEFGAFVFAAEPLGPSRRVLVLWKRNRVGPIRQLLGPSITKASITQFVLSTVAFACLLGAGLWITRHFPDDTEWHRLALLCAYLLGFAWFSIGLVAWLRTRATGAAVPRLLLMGCLFLVSVGPFVVMAISGAFASTAQDTQLLLAAPSPFYVLAVLDAVGETGQSSQLKVAAAMLVAAAYLLLGTGLLASAAHRSRRHRPAPPRPSPSS